MKRNEFALIIIIVSVVIMVTYLIANSFFGQTTLQPVTVPKANLITTAIQQPDPSVFNKDAINPAVTITIGDQANQQPFTISN